MPEEQTKGYELSCDNFSRYSVSTMIPNWSAVHGSVFGNFSFTSNMSWANGNYCLSKIPLNLIIFTREFFLIVGPFLHCLCLILNLAVTIPGFKLFQYVFARAVLLLLVICIRQREADKNIGVIDIQVINTKLLVGYIKLCKPN